MSSITLRDGTVFNLAEHFPDTTTPVSVACSGGIESSILLYLLLQIYGASNVHVCTGVMQGRRSWESTNAVRIAQAFGATNIHAVSDNFTVMNPEEQIRMLAKIRQDYSTGNHYIGEALSWYSANHTTAEVEQRSRTNRGIFVPFIKAGLTKRHTIDLYYQLGIEEYLPQTYSCTAFDTEHCGTCYCCNERVRGFNELGLIDSVTYGQSWETMVAGLNDPGKIKKNW